MCTTTATLARIEAAAAPAADTAQAMSPAEEEFSQRLLTMVNHATTGMMISIGHRTGLFEAMKQGGAATSAELAERAGLAERYVREWLGAMATARVVELDLASRRYRLPDAHGAFLGRDAANGNMAAMFQFIAVLGGVESRIVDCFRTGGGVPYEAYDRFHEVMAEESAQTVVAALDEAIIPLVPGLHAQLEAGIAVADIGCGSGRALNRLAALYPASRFTGYDLCAEAIAAAEREARALGLGNVAFAAADATHLPGAARFDLIFTFDAVHDQAHPAAVLANIRRLLKHGGVYLMQDIDSATDVAANIERPLAPFIYAISCMHCMTVSLAQGGDGLGAAWGEQLALAMLNEAGFAEVTTHRLEHDIMNLYYVCR
ncbi:MAG TPA: class I SAM-dependent methyltransferase [Allosphingosinicella sp.]|nr:class I SAM-dependent methyltransferase [Allosphingosinicella sp.]